MYIVCSRCIAIRRRAIVAAVVLVSYPGGVTEHSMATMPTASPAVTATPIRVDLSEMRSALDERETSWKVGANDVALRQR